jgi:hypothetical protein
MEDSMNTRIAALAAWTFVALAFAAAPAAAQTLDITGITDGDTFASTGDPGDTGTTGTASTTGGSLFGGSGDTIASLSLGSGGTGPVTGLATIGSGTTAGSPSGSVVLGTGTNPVNGGTTGTIILNPDGTFSIATGGPGAPAASTAPGGTFTAADLLAALEDLDEEDVAALKQKCADVLANPGSYDAATVALCSAIATA